VKWFRKAAEQGNASAQTNLGMMYEDGRGIPQDYTEAARWYRKAADQGWPTGQGFLGALYTFGTGVPKDDVLAHMWLSLAISGLPPTSEVRTSMRRHRKIIALMMTPAQIAEAQKLAREWKPKKEK
jgi:TPR repeat protein